MDHLLQSLVSDGLNLQAHTPVLEVIQTDGPGGSWKVVTPRGSIVAKKVVHTTNAYASHLLPEYAETIVPVRGVCSHLASEKGKETPHLNNTYGVHFDRVNSDYLIPRSDGSIVVGGARQTFWHNKTRWFDNVRDDELLEEALPYFTNYMQRHFKGWEGSNMVTREVWTGSTFENGKHIVWTDLR